MIAHVDDMPSRRVGILAVVCTTAGCDFQARDAGVSVDDAAIMSTLSGHRNSPAFVRLNEAPYPSAIGDGANVNIFVSTNAYAAYGSITPDSSGSGVVVPQGTLLVREVLQTNGAIGTLAVMFKAPKGYNAAMGDLWLGVTDASGNPTLDDAGAPRIGRLAECAECHAARASDGYLFGVPEAVRPQVAMPAPTPTPTPPPVPPLPPPPPPPPMPPPICGDFVCNGDEDCKMCSADCGRCHGPGDDDDGSGGGKGSGKG